VRELKRLVGRPLSSVISFLVVAAAGLLSTSLIVNGQGITTGTITGTVVDPSGAAVPNSQITATSNGQGTQRQAVSGSAGEFSLYSVPIGQYTLTISAPGFAPATVNSIQVNAGATSGLKAIKLSVASGTAQVEVNGAAAALLQTTDSQVTTTFDAQALQNIPLNNGFDTVAELIPGVVSTHAANFSNANGDNFSVNGQRGRSNNFEIDGQSNNDNSISGPQVFFGNQDAIQEIQVITNDFSAQYGRNAGSVVNYLTKSGSNAFHGSGFELYNGSFLQSLEQQFKSPLAGFCPPGVSPSTGCLVPSVPRVVENRYGGTIGGPVIKDKLFFFGSTYWDPIRNGASPSNSGTLITPTPAGLTALQAGFPNNPAVGILTNFGPYSVKPGNPGPVPGTTTNETFTNASGQLITVPFSAIQRTIPSIDNDQEDLGRLDWQPTAKDRLMLRYFYQNTLSEAADGDIPTGQWVNVPATTHSVGADWTHVFNEHWLDQIRYSFQQSKTFFQGGGHPNCVANDLGTCPAYLDFFDGTDAAFGENPDFPQGRTVKVTQVQDNATWTRGSHTFLFGGEFDYQNSPNTFLVYYNPLLGYNTFSDFLTDSSSGIAEIADGNPTVPFTEGDVAAYFQDDWKVTPSFTAHLGLRWEYYGQAVNKLHMETVARETNPATAFWDQSLPLSVRTVPAVQEVYHNFQPRLGFAWNPDFDRKLVVSAGYSINTDPEFTNPFLNAAQASPVANAGVVGCPCQPASGLFTSAATRAVLLPSLPTGGNPRFRDSSYVTTNYHSPYTQTYILGVQYQVAASAVVSVRYVGAHTVGNFQAIDANPYLLPVAQAFPNVVNPSSLCQDTTQPGVGRPDCTYSNRALVNNGAWSIYNGLQTNLTTRSYHGLTTTVSYTWSRTLDNASEIYPTGTAGNVQAYSQNPLDPNLGERGVNGNSFPNVIGLSFDYQFPTLAKGSGFLSSIVNGYQLNGLYRYNSGQPYQPFQSLNISNQFGPDSSFCDTTFQGSTVGSDDDVCRLILSNKSAPLNTIAYLNPYGGPNQNTPVYVDYNSDFVDANGVYHAGTPVSPTSSHWIINNQAEALALGNPYAGSGRNILRAQPFDNLDASIYKTTKLSERVTLQLQFNAYNAFNHALRSAVGDNVGDGSVTSSVAAYNTQAPGQPQAFLSNQYGLSNQRFIVLGGKIIF
jgi:Carboxypeptidase regulatory-like domain/TonB-dependent Receptor Plug Domain